MLVGYVPGIELCILPTTKLASDNHVSLSVVSDGILSECDTIEK